mgnify:CR=1 FL=1
MSHPILNRSLRSANAGRQGFTLLELQRVHETVLGRPLNKDSFRRRMLSSGELEATGESQKDVDHRPAELYRFARRSAV